MAPDPYYRRDLALVHHRGFGFHADACAPGILALLEPVRERDGLVLELGCGSGLLTRHLLAAGHWVVATDASPAMLELAGETLEGAEEIRLLALPDDPLPRCDAIVSVGHVLNYLPAEASVERALGGVGSGAPPRRRPRARSLRPALWSRPPRRGEPGAGARGLGGRHALRPTAAKPFRP